MKKIIAIAIVIAGCDATYAGFFNSVPENDDGHPVHVIIGVDGLSKAAFEEARAQGAFGGWNTADLVTVFPGTSDYAWTRTLRAAPLDSYEVQYYDPAKNAVVGDGLGGVLEHPIHQGAYDVLPCWQKFDFLGDGDLWMLRGYGDPEDSYPAVVRAMFSTLEGRAPEQSTFLAYLINIDIMGHSMGRDHAVQALVYLDAQIRAFQAAHPGRFKFTLISDHGNTHTDAQLVDMAQALRDVGVSPVESLSAGAPMEAVAIIHVRNNYVALHTHPERIADITKAISGHQWVDHVAAPLGGRRYVFARKDQWMEFSIAQNGDVLIDDAAAFQAAGIDVGAASGPVRLADRDAFDRTLGSQYPDLFHRVDGAFTDPAARVKADVLIGLRDDIVSYGFHLPGGLDQGAVHGFHGGLSRKATISVVATQTGPLPATVRTDDLGDLFPDLIR